MQLVQTVTSKKANRSMGFLKWDDYFGFAINLNRSRNTEKLRFCELVVYT